ncbi:hypothetical protein UA32_12560 [Photobacterium angustum]|uniref:Uncharacterized protein n=1 Tax=Photobacterium angustum TaxID=661 RepID=A0ABX5H1T7_PHOAN|nr:hypothetical protein [Photobacterium angustum]KJG37778.1 hypothetical protein UA32_12560 [Photobacterium angustum]PSX07047.1 hypothetical protein C0W27_15880 [Photobacterium angustum]
MYYALLGFFGFAVFIVSEKFLSASVAEQAEALGTLSTILDILLVPLIAIVFFITIRWFCSTSTGKKFLDLD